jgi:hypothetical protein
MSFRLAAFPITHFDYDESRKSLKLTGIARHAGSMTYRSDAGDRVEFVSPDLNKALDSQGLPYIRQLGGAPVTCEHPPNLIRQDAEKRKQYQVGEVAPKIKVYHDGRVQVDIEVFDSATIDAVTSGRKRGFSMGYRCNVVRQDGIHQGQRYTHVQSAPIEIDHLAIVASPRAPEALIQGYRDAANAVVDFHRDSEGDGFAIAWRIDTKVGDRKNRNGRSYVLTKRGSRNVWMREGQEQESAQRQARKAEIEKNLDPEGRKELDRLKQAMGAKAGKAASSGAKMVITPMDDPRSEAAFQRHQQQSKVVRKLRDQLAEGAFAHDPNAPDGIFGRSNSGKGTALAALDDAANNPRVGLISARGEDGQYSGFMSYKPGVKRIQITHLGTDGSQKGDGRKMFDQLLQEAARTGKGLEVATYKEANGFYEKMGMTRDGPDSNSYTMSPDQVKAAISGKQKRDSKSTCDRECACKKYTKKTRSDAMATLTFGDMVLRVDAGEIASLEAMLTRIDKGKKCPGGYYIAASKNCRGGSSAATAKREAKALGKLGKTQSKGSADRKKRIAEIKAKAEAKYGKGKDIYDEVTFGSRGESGKDKGKAAITALNQKNAKKNAANKKRKATNELKAKQKTLPSGKKSLGANKVESPLAAARKKKSIKSTLDALGLGGVTVDSRRDAMQTLFPVKLGGETYHIDADDYLELAELIVDRMDDEDASAFLDGLELNLDEDDDWEDEDEDEVMDSSEHEDEDDDEDEDDVVMDSAIETLLERIDTLEALLSERLDSNTFEQVVQNRLDSLFATYDDAKPYLPADFRLDGSMSAVDVMKAAIAYFDPSIKLDSDDSVEGAYALLKKSTRVDTAAALHGMVDTANRGGIGFQAKQDSGPRPLAYQKRKA